jgi:hypothetical protein
MVLAAHRESHRCAQGNSERLPEICRGSGVPAGMGAPSTGKTGQRGDPRPRSIKTGHRGDPRLCSPFFRKTGRWECPFSTIGKCL